MYYVSHRKIGYIVAECDTLEEAKAELKSFGRAFEILDSFGNVVKEENDVKRN